MEITSLEEVLDQLELRHLLDHFNRNCVSFKTLFILSESEIKELVPQIGARRKLINFLASFHSNESEQGLGDESSAPLHHSISTASTLILDNENVDPSTLDNETSNSTDENCIEVKVIDSTDYSLKVVSEDVKQEELPACSSGAPSKKFKEIKRFFLREKSLSELIQYNSKLYAIKKAYLSSGKLDPQQRKAIVSVVIDSLLDRHNTVNKETLRELSTCICEEFPSETMSTYYSFDANISKNPRGKLPDRLRNELSARRRWLQQESCSTNIDDDAPSVVSSSSSAPIPADVKKMITWLKHSEEPWVTVIDYWMKTFEIRNSDTHSLPLHTFTEKWPLIQHQNGHALVDVDFEYIYPGKCSMLFTKWPRVVEIVLNELKNTKLIPASFECDDERNFYAAYNLPSLVPAGIRKSAKTAHWKPSSVECCEHFIKPVSSVEDMKRELVTREKFCRTKSCTLQPSIFRVKSSDAAPVYYLSLNRILYKFSSCLKALDISTKLHQVLNLQYMHQSNQAYTFLQRCAFGISTEHDRISPSLSILMSQCDA